MFDGTIVGAADALSRRLAVSTRRRLGPARSIVGPDGARRPRRWSAARASTRVGPLGQRDSSGTGTTGYRVRDARRATCESRRTDAHAHAAPTPTPTPTPTPPPTADADADADPDPDRDARPTATPTRPQPTTAARPPTPTPTPSATPTIATDRGPPEPGRRRSTVRGVVTAEPGRLGTPPLIAIADAIGRHRRPTARRSAAARRGARVLIVRGALADAVRPARDPARGRRDSAPPGQRPVPAAVALGSGLGEIDRGPARRLTGRSRPSPAKASSGDIIDDGRGRQRRGSTSRSTPTRRAASTRGSLRRRRDVSR